MISLNQSWIQVSLDLHLPLILLHLYQKYKIPYVVNLKHLLQAYNVRSVKHAKSL